MKNKTGFISAIASTAFGIWVLSLGLGDLQDKGGFYRAVFGAN
ncbi:MAG: hypothetical protein RBT65_14310 [Methanolobus sp.]|jgi:hypothetical protein|nr:hypothetical protein [Methanolobus sp.]